MGRGDVKTILMIGGLLVAGSNLEAQSREGPGGFFGVSFVAADAVGELGTMVDQGFGLEFAGGVPMAAGGHLRLRADFGFLVYGLETQHYCNLTCRVGSDLTTANGIVYGGIGPELVFGAGDFRPYVHGSAGLSYFVTSSSLDDNDGYGPYFETTNYSDVVFSLRYGGGIRFRAGGHTFIDLGVERHQNGVAQYLTRGDIEDHRDGSITMFPNRSEANLMTFRLGVSFAAGGS